MCSYQFKIMRKEGAGIRDTLDAGNLVAPLRYINLKSPPLWRKDIELTRGGTLQTNEGIVPLIVAPRRAQRGVKREANAAEEGVDAIGKAYNVPTRRPQANRGAKLGFSLSMKTVGKGFQIRCPQGCKIHYRDRKPTGFDDKTPAATVAHLHC